MSRIMLSQRRTVAGEAGSVAPPPSGDLLGVGSHIDTTTDYPKTGPVFSGDLYVDGNGGSDSNDGTSLAQPFKTIGKALAEVSDGETIIVRGGTYQLSSKIIRQEGWSVGIKVFAYGTERPILDGSLLANTEGNRVLHFWQEAKREHWKGFDVVGGPSHGVYNEGDYVIIEDFVIYDCVRGYEANPGPRSGGGNNIVQDTVAFAFSDTSDSSSNAADGIVFTANNDNTYYATNNAVVRCLVANSGDDGFDFFRTRDSKILNSVSISAGRYRNGNNGGDGNGFKTGGVGGFNNDIIGNISIYSNSQDITSNSAHGAIRYENNTMSFGYYGLGLTDGSGDEARSNLSVNHTGFDYWDASGSVQLNNSWQTGTTGSNVNFGNIAEGDFSLMPDSSAISSGVGGVPQGASFEALILLKKWWNHSLIWVPGRGNGPGGTGLPGDTP